jgi:serine/threonine protein kinase
MKLGREVALKVLPDEFARDGDRLSRFQREAQVLASLNHPHIGQIYGLEESSGSPCLVLELVEGDTLQDRLKRGPVPQEQALNMAVQIAEGIEAAHQRGIIHRDLDFDGNGAPEARIHCAVVSSHPSLAERSKNLVRAEFFSGRQPLNFVYKS